jgi:hypothetical protein
MVEIDVGDDDEDVGDAVVALVVAVVELLVEALEREAIRRMESGRLGEEEIDRLGRQLAALEEEIEGLKQREDVGDSVEDLRDQLDTIVQQAVETGFPHGRMER